MRKRFVFLVCLFILPMVPIGAVQSETSTETEQDSSAIVLGVGLDTSVLDAVWTNHIQARIVFNCRLSSGFGLRLPLTFSMNKGDVGIMLFDFGIFLDYHPWGEGPFISIALAQFGILAGRDRPVEPFHFLNEVSLGWTWHVYEGLYIEPALIIRDPSGGFEVEYDGIREFLPGVRPLRFSLVVGWDFLRIPDKVR